MPAEDHEKAARLAEILDAELRQGLGQVPRHLAEKFADQGLQLDSMSRHPRYTFEHEFIVVEVDELRLMATLRTRGGKPRRLALDSDLVAAATADTASRLFARRTGHIDGPSLEAAYEFAISSEHLEVGSDVPIRSIVQALAHEQEPPPLDELNVDLAQVIAEAQSSGRPHIVLSNTRDTSSGLLLHGMEQAGYIGYLRIERGRR